MQASSNLDNLNIISCLATNTRLMGVVGGLIHYELEGKNLAEFFIFDFDIMELGRHEQVYNPGSDDIKAYSDEYFGSLGGELIALDFWRDFLAMFFLEMKRSNHSSYKIAKKKSPLLSKLRKNMIKDGYSEEVLFPKHELSEYEICHYFLMRYFEIDELCLDFCDFSLDFDMWDPDLTGMVIKNTLRESEGDDGMSFYDFSSILFFGSYFLVNGSLGLEDGLITGFSIEEHMQLPPNAVAKMMRKEEFITIYQIVMPGFESAFCMENRRIEPQLYESGTLMVSYKKDNSHVDQSVYSVNNDIEASLFVTDASQLVVCTDSDNNGYEYIQSLEDRYGDQLVKIADYLFDDRVFLDFIASSSHDFIEWLEG